jgi:hypothetical protein
LQDHSVFDSSFVFNTLTHLHSGLNINTGNSSIIFATTTTEDMLMKPLSPLIAQHGEVMSFLKRSLISAFTLLIIAMAMNWSPTETLAQGQTQSPVAQPPAGEPDVTPDDDKNDQIFYRKNLSVRNQTNERITVFLQFRAFNPALKKWEWQPSVPASGQAVAFEIEPGEEKLLETVDRKVVASYVRIWAISENLMWNNFRNNDFYLVPMSENGVREYKAFKLETLTYVFSGPKNPDPEFLESPVPYNMAVEYAQPLNIIPDQDQNTVISNSSPIDQFISVPLPLPNPITIPDVIPLPDVPIIREADLAVLGLEVQSQGSFTGRIRNNGPSTYTGGRAWYLLASVNEGPFRTVLKGVISGLRPGSGMFVSGTFPRVTQPSRFVLMLTPGDLQASNDFIGVRVMPPPRADLAITNAYLNNGVVTVDVINNGPTEYSGFFRRCSIMDTRSVLTAGPLSKIVPALAAGQQVSLQFPVSNIDPGPGNALIATLNRGDSDPSNDRISKPLDTSNVVIQGRDYAAGSPFLNGNQLTAVITSDSGREFGSRFFSLSYESLDGFKRSDQIRGIITATPNAPQTVQLSMPPRMLTTPFQASLTLTRDANPTNNVATKTFNANQGTAVADIQVVNAFQSKNNPNMVIVQIRNNGPDAYTGNKLVMISGSNGMASNTTPIRTGTSITAGQTVRIPLTMNSGMPTGQYTASLGQTTPDTTKIIDNNNTNETAVFTYNSSNTPPGPIAGGMGVGIASFTIDNTGKVNLTTNIEGGRNQSGKISVSIKNPKLQNTVNQTFDGVTGQDLTRTFNHPLIADVISAMKPGEKQTFQASIVEQGANGQQYIGKNSTKSYEYTAENKMGGMGVGISAFSIDNTGQVSLRLTIKGGRPSTGPIRVTITSPNLQNPSIREIPGISFDRPAQPWTDSKIAELINKLKNGAKEKFTVTVAEKNAGQNESSTFIFVAGGKLTPTKLSVSDLKVDQKGNVTFKLTNPIDEPYSANADQFSISSSTSPSNTKATPYVPAKSTIVVGDGSQAGGSVSVAAIVNQMKPNESTQFTVQLQSNQATARFEFTKADLSALTVSSASINPITKDLTFVLSNNGTAVDRNADRYFVTSDPQIPGDIARAEIPAMSKNSHIVVEVKGSAAKLAKLSPGKEIVIKLEQSKSSTTYTVPNMPSAGLTVSDLKVDQAGNLSFKLSNSGNAANKDDYTISTNSTKGMTINKTTPVVQATSSMTVGDNSQAGGLVSVASIVNNMKPQEKTTFTVTLKSGSQTTFIFTKKTFLSITDLKVDQAGNLSFKISNSSITAAPAGADTYIIGSTYSFNNPIQKSIPRVPANGSITLNESMKAIIDQMKPNDKATFSVSLKSSGTDQVFNFTKAAPANLLKIISTTFQTGPNGKQRVSVAVQNSGTEKTARTGVGVSCKLEVKYPNIPSSVFIDLGKKDVSELAAGNGTIVTFELANNLPKYDKIYPTATIYP